MKNSNKPKICSFDEWTPPFDNNPQICNLEPLSLACWIAFKNFSFSKKVFSFKALLIKVNGSKLQIWGLLSNGGVHSSNEHIFGIRIS